MVGEAGGFFTCPHDVENHGDGYQHTNTVRKRRGELVSADLTLPVFHENVGCLQTAEGKTLPDVLCTSCQPTVTDHCERSANFQLYSDHTNVINEHKLNPTKIFCFYSIKCRWSFLRSSVKYNSWLIFEAPYKLFLKHSAEFIQTENYKGTGQSYKTRFIQKYDN